MSTKPFYDRNAAFVVEVADVERARKELQTPGTRYHYVSEKLSDAGQQLLAPRKGGRKARCGSPRASL